MQTRLTVITIVFTSLRLSVLGRITDYNTFSVMVDDNSLSRNRVHNSDTSSTSQMPMPKHSSMASSSALGPTNDSLTAPSSVGSMVNISSPNKEFEVRSISWMNDSAANNFLEMIRSTNNDSNIHHLPAARNTTESTTMSRGYIKSGLFANRKPTATRKVGDALPSKPNGNEANQHYFDAKNELEQESRPGLLSVPGLRRVLPANEPSINAGIWLTFQRNDNADGILEYLDEAKSTAHDQHVSSSEYVSDDSSDDGPRFSSVSDEIKTTEDTTWIKQDADLDDVWMIKKTPSLTASNQGQDSDLGDANARKTPRIILASNQERDSNSRRLDNRHFVHIRDDAPSKILIKNREQHRNGRRGHDSEDQEEDRGEHKKTERRHSVIVKAVDEWRCLETEAGRGTDQPNIQKLVCPPGLMITSFGLASVGNPKGSCQGQDSRQPGSCHVDLSKILQSRCAGKSVCDIDSLPLAVDEIRNQCRNQTRPADVRAVIEYQCSPWVSNPILANSTLDHCQTIENNGTLQCPQGQAILGFGFGFYGEIDGSCSKGISPGICSRNVMTDLTTQCVGRNQCRVDMGSTPFGSACINNKTILTLASSFKCGALADAVSNFAKMVNESYVSKNLQFTKGNGAESKSVLVGALITTSLIFLMF